MVARVAEVLTLVPVARCRDEEGGWEGDAHWPSVSVLGGRDGGGGGGGGGLSCRGSAVARCKGRSPIEWKKGEK